MQHNHASKKKRWITASIAGAVAVTVIGTALYHDSSVALARPSLPGIEDIINGNSKTEPFTILEIVDEYPSARVGYTVAGEEPGDTSTAMAISDMASYEERAAHYMKDSNAYAGNSNTNPSSNGNTPFGELKDYAFTYTAYDEIDPKDPNTYTADTDGARNGKSFGEFVENSTPDGRYISSNSTDQVYVKIGDTNSCTIEDVYNRHSDTDGTGQFYINHVGLKVSDGTEAAADRYDINSFSKIADGDEWMSPFKLMIGGTTPLTTVVDSKTYTLYQANRYVANNITAEFQDTDADEVQDTYVLTSVLQEGDQIFKDTGNTGEYTYYAKVVDNAGTLELDSGMALSDIDPNPSFAKDVFDSIGTDSYAIMEAKPDTDDTAMYYISNVTQSATGYYAIDIDMWYVANDPDYTPATFGIIDEDTEKGGWYHEWFYKGVGEKPIVFDTQNPHQGTYDFVQNYGLDEVDNYYYKGGYVNNELFKKEVLDVDANNCSNIYVNVVTKKLQDVTADDIANARLIYFSKIGNAGYTGNMDKAAALALVKAVDQDNKPVVLNLSAFFNGAGNSVYSKQDSDAYKAMSMLLKNDVDGIAAFVGESDWNISDATKTAVKKVADAYNSMINTMDLSHVSGSVFVNDDVSVNDAIYTDFLTEYYSGKVDGFTLDGVDYDGFKEVKKDIDEEVFYLQVAQKDVNAFNQKISKATSIRYILNYGDRRVVGKTAIRVLDLEPYYAREIEGDVETYTNNSILRRIRGNGRNDFQVNNIATVRDIFAKQWFRDNVSNTTDKITVTGMGTKEFIGKIEDVNECYDLIYIGMDTAYMNTELSNIRNNNTGDKGKKVVSNDGKQYVYRHVGDEITTTGQTGVNGTWNMGGNDITPDKFNELKNYVTAGYTVILSDEFFKFKTNGQIEGIDTDRVDSNSYLYDFIEFCTTEKKNNELRFLYKNVEITSNLDGSRRATTDGRTVLAHKEEFVKYLNISKLEVDVQDRPPLYNPYEFEDTVTNKSDYHNYIGMNADGKYTLDFKVKLKNDAAVDTTNTSYNCKFYIDHDGDGRFEKVEALDSLQITNIDSNTSISPNGTDVDGHEKYELTTGSTYTISREIPEGYVGLIPWKLVFVENRDVAEGEEAAQIKVSVQDYSAISDMTNKPTIKILQLTSGGDSDNNGNTSWNGANLRLWDDAELQQMYQQVIDFNIDVTQDTMHHFIAQDGGLFQGVNRLEKLYDYDMLVLGFVDCYFFSEKNNLAKSKEAVLAVREYMLSGRSVLFTHDLTSTRISNTDATNWGVLANRYLRDIQGMDRYGYVFNLTQNLRFADGTALSEYHSAYDTRYNSNREAVGFADSTLLRKTDTSKVTYGEMAAPYNNHTEVNHDGVNERELYSVSRVNRGQITEYPFRMGDMEQSSVDSKWYASEFIPVDKTHHQYFQLNLETNYNDENYDDDIVVWYTISEHGSSKAYYASRNVNDVRNNYYIYSKGNITYTGAGHSEIKGTPEKKLFVNTLVASYNAGTHAPYAAYKNNDQRNANDITSKYLPYDISLKTDSGAGGGSGWLDTTVTIYFKTVNNNLQDNLKPTVAQYYVEVPNGTAGAVKIGTKSYKIVVPTVVKDCTSDTILTDKQVLSNGHIYELKFSISDLMNGDLEDVNRRYHAVIYTRMRSLTRGTIDSVKADFASTEELETLPASDSMKPLNINFTQLYDLK